MKDVSAYFRHFLLVVALVFATLPSAHSASYTTYQAKIVKPDGYPLEAANVNFKFTILNPAGNCVVYAETYSSVNMSGTGGLISFALGSGVKTYPVSSPTTFAQVFSNTTPSLVCEAGAPPNYTPGADDIRKIVMQFHDGTGWQTLPAMVINAVPYAMYANSAQNLNGKTAADFVEAAALVTCGAGEALSYTGAGFSCVTIPVPEAVSASEVVAALGYTPADGASVTALTSSVGTSFSVLSAQVSGFSASMAAITSSQWMTSGTAVNYLNGNVGIGTNNPVTKLDVSGGVRIGSETSGCVAGLEGTLRYNGGNVEYCNGSSWLPFGVAGAGITNVNGSTSGSQTFATGITGTVFNITTVNGVHTFNIPLAASGSVTAGLLSNSDYLTFTNKLNATSAAVVSALGYTPLNDSVSGTFVVKANNLSDLVSATVARTNLGLGALATLNYLDLGSAMASGTIASARLPAFSGDVSSVSGSSVLTLASVGPGVASGAQYTKVTVDSKGRVVSGAQLSSSDVTTALGFTPGNSASGVTALNGSTSQTQSFAIGTTGAAPLFNTAAGVHTLNIPIASSAGSVTAGLISNADYVNFSNKITSSAASIAQVLGYVPASATALGNYLVRSNNLSDLTSSATARANLGLGTFAAANTLDLGSASATGTLATVRLPAFSGDASSASGSNILTLASVGAGVASGTQYTKVTVDGKGRVVSGAQLSPTDVTTALGFTPAQATSATQWTTSGSTIYYSAGNIGIGTNTPTAALHLKSGTSQTSSLKLTSGTLLTTPQAGAIEYDGVNYYVTDGGSVRRVLAMGSSSGAVDDANNINNSSGNIVLTPNGSVVVSATTVSTNANTGALIVKGGLGVAGNINASGSITTSANIQGASITATSGLIAPYIAGGNAAINTLTLDSTTHATKGNILLAPNGGNVGIANNSPGGALEIGTNSVSSSSYRFAPSTLDQGAMRFTTNSSANWIQSGLDYTPDSKKDLKFSSISGMTTWMTLQASTGSLGIGTQTPTQKLDVIGGVRSIYGEPTASNTNASGFSFDGDTGMFAAADGRLNFWSNYQRTMSLYAGNVGIGTSAPTTLLHVKGGISDQATVEESGGRKIIFSATSMNQEIKTSAGNLNLKPDTGIVQVYSSGSPGSLRVLDVSATPNVILSASGASYFTGGNIGIGTSAPASLLHLAVPTDLEGTPGIFIQDPTTNSAYGGKLYYDDSGGRDALKMSVLDNNVETGYLAIERVSGNVGIGTAKPDFPLHVSGSVRVHGNIYGGGNASGTPSGETNGMWVYGPGYPGFGMFYTEGSPDNISISPNGGGTSNPVMTVLGSGYVGIGTSAPTNTLSVTGGGLTVNRTQTFGGIATFVKSYTAANNEDPYISLTHQATLGGSFTRYGYIQAGVNLDGMLLQGTNSDGYSNIILNRYGGKVGVGIAVPTVNDSSGTAVHIHSASGRAAGTRFTTSSTGTTGADGFFVGKWTDGAQYGDGPILWNYEPTPITFATSATERLTITSAGRVGIGTIAPATNLEVSSNNPGGYTVISNTNVGAGGLEWRWYSSSTGAPLGTNSMCFGTGACLFSLYLTGNATLTGTLTQSSDQRLKRDISSLSNALDAVTKLEGVTYYWKDAAKDPAKQLGLIAQEVEKVFPEAVKTNEQGYKSVAYQNLIAPVIEAIKELLQRLLGVEATIKQQSQQIEILKNKSSELEEQNQALKNYLCEKDPMAPICK